MKSLLTVSLLASLAAAAGCATSGNGLPGRDGKGPGGVRPPDLAPDGTDEVRPSFPDRVSQADLPAADRLSHRITVERGGAIASQVRLCVGPDGAVDKVDLVESSGMAEYDQVVVDTVGSWQYAAYAAPAETTVCQNLTVGYKAP